MKNKLFKSISIALMAMMMFTGCGSKADPKEIVELQTALNEQTAINTELQTQVDSLQSQVNALKQEKEDLIEQIREADGAELKLYTANVDTLAKEQIGKITVNLDANGEIEQIEEVLDFMADELSKQVFEGLSIEIQELKNVAGKTIVVINLEENNNLGVGWESNFLQGSTGAAITDLTLRETFLQKEYEGKWIDGIQILYEGNTAEFDHMPELGKIIYR